MATGDILSYFKYETAMEVVCALIIQNKKVLLCQRPSHKANGDLWEFPGGKVETNESLEQALCRELNEELGLFVAESSLTLLGKLSEHSLTLHFFIIALREPYAPREHRATSWADLKSLHQFPLCPHDKKAVHQFAHSISSALQENEIR